MINRAIPMLEQTDQASRCISGVTPSGYVPLVGHVQLRLS